MGPTTVTAQGGQLWLRDGRAWTGLPSLSINPEHVAPHTGQGSRLSVFALKGLDKTQVSTRPGEAKLLEANATLWQLPELQVSKGILWQVISCIHLAPDAA